MTRPPTAYTSVAAGLLVYGRELLLANSGRCAVELRAEERLPERSPLVTPEVAFPADNTAIPTPSVLSPLSTPSRTACHPAREPQARRGADCLGIFSSLFIEN